MASSAALTSTASRFCATSSARPSNSSTSRSGGVLSGTMAVAVLGDHRQRAAGEVAVVVGQLGVVAGLEPRGRDRPVLAEGHLAQQVEAQRVGAVGVHDLERVEHVAQRLGHLVLVHQQVAVDEHLARHLDVGRHQQRGPEHRVELEDVLGDHVHRGRPEGVGQVLALARVGQRRVVVQERVHPHVDHLLVVPRDRHAPGDPRARQREVAQPALDERQRLVVARARAHEVRPLGVQLLEPLLERRELEEPVLLVLAVQLDQVDRAAVALQDLVLGLEVRAARAVPALVQVLVDVAVLLDPLHDPLDHRAVLGVAGADEEVVGGVHPPRHLLEPLGVLVGQLARGDALSLRRQRHRLAVLVGAREEEDLLAALAHVAGQHVGGDGRVDVPQVGLAVHVVDRGGYVVGHATTDPTSGRRGFSRHIGWVSSVMPMRTPDRGT